MSIVAFASHVSLLALQSFRVPFPLKQMIDCTCLPFHLAFFPLVYMPLHHSGPNVPISLPFVNRLFFKPTVVPLTAVATNL